MSLSIIASPDLYSPVYSPIVFVVDSTYKAECKFHYLCDVYVEDELAVRLKLEPTGEDLYGEFHVNRILENYVTFDLFPNIDGFEPCPNSIKKYHIVFREMFDGSDNCDAYATEAGSLETDPFYVWNGAYQHEEYNAATYQKFGFGNNSSTGFFLSCWQPPFPGSQTLANQPQYQGLGLPMRVQDSMWSCFLNYQSEQILTLRVDTYDETGEHLGRYDLDNPYHETDGSSEQMMIAFPVGPKNLNEVQWSAVTPYEDGTPQFPIYTRVHYYVVRLMEGATARSQMYRVDIDRKPSKFAGRRVIWMNRYGGFDGYTFTAKDRRSVDVQRDGYNRLIQSKISGSPLQWGFDREKRGRTVSSVKAKEKLQLTSGWMTDSTALYLEDLFTSPEVYESTCDTPRCFTSTSASGVDLEITFAQPHGLLSTDSVRVDLCDPTTNPEYMLEGGVNIVVTDPYTIELGLSYGEPVENESGIIYKQPFDSVMKPLVVTTGSYEQKSSAANRLFNYTVDVESAHEKNVQRG